MTDPKKARLFSDGFFYVPSSQTDIRKTFKRLRREMAEAAKKQPGNVKPLKKGNGRA